VGSGLISRISGCKKIIKQAFFRYGMEYFDEEMRETRPDPDIYIQCTNI